MIPEEEIARHRYTLWTSGVQVSTLGLSKQKADEFFEILKDYVSSRFSGHSREYAFASLGQRLLEPTPEEDGFRARLFEKYPNLPRDWVRPDPFATTTPAFTNSLGRFSLAGRRFIVVDGEIAWAYSVPPMDSYFAEVRVDAREFDPKIRPKFDAARQEAEQNLQKKGIKKAFGYVHHLESEVDSILIQKYGIKRRNFRELNPGTNVD
jgi:hypothetical protein